MVHQHPDKTKFIYLEIASACLGTRGHRFKSCQPDGNLLTDLLPLGLPETQELLVSLRSDSNTTVGMHVHSSRCWVSDLSLKPLESPRIRSGERR